MAVWLEMRAFGATSLREWRTLRRYPSIFIGVLFWPLVLPGVYLLQANGFSGQVPSALAAFASRAGTTQVAGFLYVGGMVYMWLSVILWGPGTSLRSEQLRGSLEQLFLTPSSRVAILFGPAPAHMIQALWMFIVVGVALRFLFNVPIGPFEALRALVVITVAVPSLLGIGALFASAVIRFQEVGSVVQAVRGIFQVLCGMTFPIVVLPSWARLLALAMPPTYVLADIRAVLLGGARLAALLSDLLVLLGLAALICGLAVVALRLAEARARRTGSLGQY